MQQNRIKIFFFYYLFLTVGFAKSYSQTTVFIDLDLENKGLKIIHETPSLGQYAIYAYLNGVKKIPLELIDDPLYPKTVGSITFSSNIDVIRFEIESPGFMKYLDELHIDQLETDEFSLGKVKLIKSDFPTIVNVLTPKHEKLNYFEVSFDNPSKKRFVIDTIKVSLSFFYDSNVNGINYSSIPEKTFIIKPEIFQKANKSIEVEYLDTSKKHNLTYTATGKLEAYPTKKTLKLTCSIQTLLEIQGTSAYKTTIALPKEFLFNNQFEFEKYIESNSNSLPEIIQLKKPNTIKLTFYSSSANNKVSYEKKN